jgi:hypothetical protein
MLSGIALVASSLLRFIYKTKKKKRNLMKGRKKIKEKLRFITVQNKGKVLLIKQHLMSSSITGITCVSCCQSTHLI